MGRGNVLGRGVLPLAPSEARGIYYPLRRTLFYPYVQKLRRNSTISIRTPGSLTPNHIPLPALASAVPLLRHDPSVYTIVSLFRFWSSSFCIGLVVALVLSVNILIEFSRFVVSVWLSTIISVSLRGIPLALFCLRCQGHSHPKLLVPRGRTLHL